jgi:diguanylate cyclase (GGDEF)-like protein
MAIIAIGSVLLATSRVDEQARYASDQAESAVLVSQISVDLREPIAVMFVTASAFLQNAGTEPPVSEVRTGLLTIALQLFQGSEDTASTAPPVPLPPVSIAITDQNAFALQSAVHAALHRTDSLLDSGGPGVSLAPVAEEREKLETALNAYIETKSATSFRDTFAALVALGRRLSEAGGAYGTALSDTQSSLASATNLARYTMIAALIFVAVTMGLTTYFVGRVIQRAFQSGETERQELRATTETLQYRNDQLNALYNVFAEITDTLSMRYVINATLRETQRLMRASFVTMRLLRGSQLVAVGTLTDDNMEPDLEPVPLGEGPTGRVARRGRSMRIDYGAQELLGQSVNPDRRVESGIIVPLIVGARIVGTLACWSSSPNAFQDHDERVLEMMASQVATAVLAADTQETLERRALSDPLTNLPNRRQLSEDMAEFAAWGKEGRSAIVAMMDIDHFKQVNDEFGHKVGDVTLQKIASVMRQAIRDTDRIYRYGGEEFVMIFPDAGAVEAVPLAERVLKAVAETPLTGEGLEPVGPLTISAGLAIMPLHGEDISELIVLADRALYHAKQGGRNRIEVWQDDDEPSLLSGAA